MAVGTRIQWGTEFNLNLWRGDWAGIAGSENCGEVKNYKKQEGQLVPGKQSGLLTGAYGSEALVPTGAGRQEWDFRCGWNKHGMRRASLSSPRQVLQGELATRGMRLEMLEAVSVFVQVLIGQG